MNVATSKDRPNVYSFTTRRPVATMMVVLAVATFGYISMEKIPLELLPEISYPTITIRTEYQGAAPEDVEERISKRIEEALAVIPGLERHASVSRAGVSDVVLEFRWGTNLSLATQGIRERLDRTPLPDDAEAPLILRYDPSQEPVLRLSVFGDRDLDTLREEAEEKVAKGLQTVRGVAAVKVRGGLETEIRVALDEKKISNLGLDISEIDRRLKIENVNLASGTLIEGDTEYLVRTLNQFASLDEILELAIVDRSGQPIRMRDVATVTRTHKERDVVTRVDGRESVELLVYREAGANIVQLSQEVRDRVFGSDRNRQLLADIRSGKREDPEVALARELLVVEREKDTTPKPTDSAPDEQAGFGSGESRTVQQLRAQVAEKRAAEDFFAARLRTGVEVRLLADQARTIQASIDEVRGAALIGGLLAVLVLLLFLKDMVATAIIALAIPVSVIATFAPMFMVGTTLNIMSLGGLALGIGMLVDNSIVVLESIFRCREEGDDVRASAGRGTAEVGTAVIASTLTTIAVFFPIAFVEGVAGQIFGDQALTVVFALFSSLLVALFFIPMLASRARGATAAFSPARFLVGLVAPIVLWSRTTSVRGLAELTRRADGGRRWPLLLAMLPVTIVQLVLELAARTVAGALTLLLYCVIAGAKFLHRLLTLLVTPVRWSFDLFYNTLARQYPIALRAILTRPALCALTLILSVTMGYFALRALGSVGTEMLPEVHQGELMLHAYLPVGTSVERSADALAGLEQQIAALPEVAQVATTVGVARDEVAEPDEGSHSARLFITLAPTALGRTSSARELVEASVSDRIRQLAEALPELAGFRLSRPSLFSIRAALAVEARGENLTELREAATELAERMRQLPAIADVRSTVTRGNPEVHLTFDRERLRRFGLDIEAISNRIRAQVQGVVSTRFSELERRIDVRVLSDIATVDALLDITVNRGQAVDLSDTLDRGREGAGGSTGVGTAGIRDRSLLPGTTIDLGEGAPIPLRHVADVVLVEGPSEIRRINGQRAAVVTANSRGLDVGKSVESLQGVMAAVESHHPHILCSIGGQGAEMGAALGGMRAALLLAVFLVYLVMASQFESILQPLIILLSVPLALVGAAFALEWTDTPISVVVLIGIIVLAGIVVNNAIVLLDYTNQLRDRGRSTIDALVEAGQVRLRPILMTTLSTVLALLPLAGVLANLPVPAAVPEALWRGSELQAPLAITVIGGLSVSTLLTLVLIPVVYRMVARPRRTAPT